MGRGINYQKLYYSAAFESGDPHYIWGVLVLSERTDATEECGGAGHGQGVAGRPPVSAEREDIDTSKTVVQQLDI